MSLTLAEYQRLALRTEAPLDPDTLTEVQEQGIETARGFLGHEMIGLGVCLDRVKRGAIYGKAGFTHIPASEPRPPLDRRGLRLLHAALGVASETGELALALNQEPLDVVNLQEELGDILWYLAVAADAIGTDLGSIGEANVKKLAVRFKLPSGLPEGSTGYTATDALNRDLGAERTALEGTPAPSVEVVLDRYFRQMMGADTQALRPSIAAHPAVIASNFPPETMDLLVRQMLDNALEQVLPQMIAQTAPLLSQEEALALNARVEHSLGRTVEVRVIQALAETGLMQAYAEALEQAATTVLTPILGDGVHPLPEG
jgi:hypothetical protein